MGKIIRIIPPPGIMKEMFKMAVEIDATKSARVAAVKEFATTNYEKGGWDIVVETMSDQDILEIVKKARTPKTAIRAMANHIGAKAEYRDEVQGESGEQPRRVRRGRAKTSRQIRKALERAEGPQLSPSVCATCLTEVGSLEELQNHDCAGILNGTVNSDKAVDLSSLADKPALDETEVLPTIKLSGEMTEIDLTNYEEPTEEEKDAANAEYLVDADAQELNLDAPNGYFKNGNPKPVSKKDRERLGLPPVEGDDAK
jgi:hypothetical protein